MDSKSRHDLNTETSFRPQFNVGGQVSILRNSLPSLTSSANLEASQFSSWATASPQTTYFQSELPVLPREENNQLPKDMASPNSKSLNPEMLMREFMHDDSHSEPGSPPYGFKSSFAQEIMQNVRKNERQQASKRHPSHLENSSDPCAHLSKDTLLASESGRLSIPIVASPSRSSNKLRLQMLSKNIMIGDNSSDEQEVGDRLNFEDQWMSSSSFKAYLDKQETLDNSGFDTESPGNENMSYLDQDAKIPFRKLKQTCDDLGFSFTETEWSEMGFQLPIETNQCIGDDFVVRNGDFFAAVTMSNKHSRNHRDDAFKYSLKSDCGGEMEGCKYSDSELERKLHKKVCEIQLLQSDVNNAHRNLAERDTELFRIRLECQRLLEDNRRLREQLLRIKMYRAHSKQQIELEKEVDHLRWKLIAMEDSRRTYESATERLVVFLEQVTSMLQATSPSQRKFVESTRAEVSKIAKRAKMQTTKRFSLDSNTLFRAEKLPGLNSSIASGAGVLNGNFHGSLFSLSTSTGGADAGTITSSGSSHISDHPQRRGSSSSASAVVQRSQSTHSKHSNTSTLPSVRERRENSESIYINSDIIKDLIAEENQVDAEPNEHYRPQSAAAILHGKRHVCEIKIGGETQDEIHKKDCKTRKTLLNSSPAKRSNSVIASSSTAKASKILGLDLQPPLSQSIMTADSGRFSLSSRTNSPSAHSSPLPHKGILEKSFSIDSKLVESSPIEKLYRKSFDCTSVGKENKNAKVFGTIGACPSNQYMEPQEESFEMALKNGEGKNNQKSKEPTKDQRSSSNPPINISHLCKEDQGKFKSLGDLCIEKGLPVERKVMEGDIDEDKRQLVIKAAHSLMRGVRSMMTRDKTFTITPKKSSSKSMTTGSLTKHKKPPQPQLLSHTSFPGLPTYPVLAASHSSPWNC